MLDFYTRSLPVGLFHDTKKNGTLPVKNRNILTRTRAQRFDKVAAFLRGKRDVLPDLGIKPELKCVQSCHALYNRENPPSVKAAFE